MPKVYDWGIFWEDGNKASMPIPFGPEGPNEERILGIDSPWIDRVTNEIYPRFTRDALNEMPFGFIIVNPPREVDQEEFDRLFPDL